MRLGRRKTGGRGAAKKSSRGWSVLGVGFALGLVAPALVRRGADLALSSRPLPEDESATNPLRIKPRRWKSIVLGAVREFNEDQIPAAAAASTFYTLLAIFPAMAAFVSLYGLFADVEDARRQILALGGILPGGAVKVLGDQMTRLAAASHGGLGLAFAAGLLMSIWSSNAGMKSLIAGLNVAYEEKEQRGFFALNALSLTFTAGAIFLAVTAIAAVVAAPATLDSVGLGSLAGSTFLRWPALLAVVVALLSLLYRFGPCREHAKWRWITPGGAFAAVGWLAMSGMFSWYVANFGHYDKTYGSLGALIGFMTWIWLSLIVLLFGAELNAEIELNTSADTTIGTLRPQGLRGAAVADHTR